MLELLLVTSCLTTEPSCRPAAKAYYASKPQVARNLKKTRNRIVAQTGTWILYAAPVIALTGNSKKAQLRLAKNLNLQIEQGQAILLLDMEF